MTGAVIGVSFRMAFAGAMADGRPGLALVELSVVEQRYRAVLEAAAGLPVTEVAARYEVSRQSVHAWIIRYREGAVRLVLETGKPIAQVARDLGINAGTLGNWVNAERDRRDGDGALSEDERAELARLRKENAELAMRCDVLKRSVALWVQDAMGR